MRYHFHLTVILFTGVLHLLPIFYVFVAVINYLLILVNIVLNNEVAVPQRMDSQLAPHGVQ